MNGTIEFVEDEETKLDPSVKRLEIQVIDDIENVAEKLVACRVNGIKAFAIFNGIRVDNYDNKDFIGIVSQYYDALEDKSIKR